MKTETSISFLARAALLLLLLLVTSARVWANDAPLGYVDRCIGHEGSIYLNIWALDKDNYEARVTIHVYLYQDSQQKYFYNLGPTDLYRDDTVNPQYAGYHKMQRYIDVPVAGTYNVAVYALDTEGGTNTLLKHSWNGSPYPSTVDVTTSSPYTVTYNANGGSGAPAATTKSYGIDLTLSTTYPTRSGYHFMGWNTAANGSGTSYAAGATYTGNANLTLYAQWEANDLPGNGTVADPYIIRTTAGWNTFACSVNSGTETYEGKTVMLATDITVSMMVGTGSNYSNIGNLFRGTFDGCGHTLNLNIQGGSSEGAAPFHYIGGATIKNVKTTGTVSGANHCSGLVGFAASNTTNTIQSCWVDADITCTTTHASGILGWAYCATVRDCLFSGSITGSSSYTGIIYGWGDDLNEGATHTIINCLAAGTYTNCGGIHMLVRYRGTESVTNCYKTQNVGTYGTYTTATGETLRALLGDGWEVRSGNVVPKKPLTYLAYHTATHSFVELSAGNPTIVSTSTMGVADTETVYMVNSDVTISSRITVNGTVHLILADGATLTASQGITVSSGNTLNIYGQTAGTGTLNATGVKMSGDGTEAAAIGSVGTLANVFGTVTIHGGRITADGAAWSAGIGGGVNCGGGSVAIYGGTVNAIGHDGVSEAIGKGSGGTAVSKTLADGLRVTVNNNSTPVSYSDRVSSLSQKIANVAPCTEHNFSNNTCTYCGLALCHVTYDGNNATSGTAPTDAIAYASDQTVTVLGNTGDLTRTGYTFAGWNTQANGSGTTYTAGATFTINGNTTLYAKWTPITYTVRFNKNHNDATGTMSNQTFTYDVAQALATNAFTRDGWYFVGWSTETNGSSTYTDGQSIINLATEQDAVVNLYALWVQNIYTISYDLAGGTVASPNPTTFHELSGDITLVNPTKVGYYFVGWTGTGLTEPSKTVTIPAGSRGNRTYTATWIEMPLTEDTDEAEGTAAHWYVNMPATDTKTVTLSDATVTTFKVYDDGGKNGNYSKGCSGYLVLTAPTGYVLQLSGSIMSEKNYDKLTVYDGNDNSGTILLNAVCSTKDGTETAITPVLSRGQSMTLYFYDSHNDFVNYIYAGLDLTVTLIDSNVEYNIDIVDAGNNNTLTASFGGNAVTTAKYNDVVTLTASPASGYLLKDFSVVDASGNDMSVTDMRWYTGASTATFTMPASAVTVTSTFTNTWTAVGGLYINMPATGTVTATIPAGVQSFKVYDNGGAGGNYSNNCSGYLVLTAPTGYVLQLSGSITSQYYDYLTVYDGNDDSGTTLLNKVKSISTAAITTVTSTGQSMTLYFYSDGGQNYAGLDLTVTLLPVLELANNADNSDAISAADGNNRNVTLADRTLYRDGDWNTLCLPFALASFTGTPLEGATVKTLSSTGFNDGTLTMNFSENLNSIDAGVPYIVKWDDDANADLVIRSAADWNTFASNVNNGTESYAGKTVKLAANISVSTMVGVESHKFQGTFDGGGHTLNVSLSGGACTAPFSYAGAATIRNLKVTGSVTTTGNMSSGLVGFTNGALTITNCVSSVTFTSSYNGNSANGGIIGLIDDNSGKVTIEGCAFAGKILTTNGTTSCGGIVGWRRSTNITLTIKNCLYAPASLASGETEPTSDSKTICRYGNSAPTITNCYYTRKLGDSQGTDASGMSNETLASNLGDGWEVSGGNVVPKMAGTYSNIVNPVFTNVTISNTTANVSTTYVDFVGTYSPVVYDNENKSVLFLGGGSSLYYPDGKSAITIGACRAYFQLKGITAGDPSDPSSPVKAFVLNFDGEDATSIDHSPLTIDHLAGAWYDLGGRKLDGKPSKGGIYIHNGKKVVIK